MVATVAREVELWIKKLELLDLDLGTITRSPKTQSKKNKVLGFQ
jgi:hypothetical protein